MLNGKIQGSLNFENEIRVEEEVEDLFFEVIEYGKSDLYFKFIDFISSLNIKRYSIFNKSLVFAQKPTVGYFATKSHWKAEFDREVKKGARPLVMLRPGGPIMFAYDVSDTIGDDSRLPKRALQPFEVTGEIEPITLDSLIKTINNLYIKVQFLTDMGTFGGSIEQVRSYTHPNRPNIQIILNDHQDYKINYVTLIHEMAHLFLGHLGNYPYALWPSRTNLDTKTEEFEAESVAYILAKRVGLKTFSGEYLHGYLDTDRAIPKVDISSILKAVQWIEDLMNGKTPKVYKKLPDEGPGLHTKTPLRESAI